MAYKQIVGVGPNGQVACNDAPDDTNIALLGATTAAMNFYVDPVSGSDTHPGTAAEPFQTIAAALAAVPQTIKHVVYIRLASGDYNEAISPTNCLRAGSGVLVIKGSMKSLDSVDRTASAGLCAATTIGTLGAGFVVDAYDGYWIRTTTGTGSGQTKKIRENTVDTFTTCTAFNPVPDGTTHYEIYTPGARILGYRQDYFAKYALNLENTGGFTNRSLIVVALDFVNAGIFITGSVSFEASQIRSNGRVTLEGVSGYIKIGGCYYIDDAGNPQEYTFDGGAYICEDASMAFFARGVPMQALVSYAVIKGEVIVDAVGVQFAGGRIKNGATSHTILIHGGGEVSSPTLDSGIKLDGITQINLSSTVGMITMDAEMNNCSGGITMGAQTQLRIKKLIGAGNTGPIIASMAKGALVTLDILPTVTVVGGGLYKSGNRPVGTVWADLTTYGPDDDGADQKLVRAVPANPGPWTIALGVALNGMLASGLVRVHDLTAGAVLAEAAPAPGAGQFSVDYATGVVTFNTAEQTHTVAIYYRPVSYTGARIG
jgi:hypothetical protein